MRRALMAGVILYGLIFMGLGAQQCIAEKIAFTPDGREWELGYNAENDTGGIQEYVLKGETVNNWTELITVQAFFGLQNKATPEAFMETMVQELQVKCPNLKWRVIRRGSADIVFEWEVAGCPGQDDQYEIDRVLTGKTSMWHLHYVTKKMPVSANTRDEWARLLDKATLQD